MSDPVDLGIVGQPTNPRCPFSDQSYPSTDRYGEGGRGYTGANNGYERQYDDSHEMSTYGNGAGAGAGSDDMSAFYSEVRGSSHQVSRSIFAYKIIFLWGPIDLCHPRSNSSLQRQCQPHQRFALPFPQQHGRGCDATN